MTLMASKPANEAMLESGVTTQEFLYFQNMLNKNPAINYNLNLVSCINLFIKSKIKSTNLTKFFH